jgi:hypothetical protein
LQSIGDAAGSYPGDQFTFKQLIIDEVGNPSPVRLIKSVGFGMVLATDKELLVIKVDNQSFDRSTPAELVNLLSLPDDAGTVSDVVVVWNGQRAPDDQFIYIIATTKGVFASLDDGNRWHELILDGRSGLPVVQLVYLSNRRSIDGPQGNLYVMAADRVCEQPWTRLYRFVFDLDRGGADRIKAIAEPHGGSFLGDVAFYGSVYLDGSLALFTRGKQFANTDFLIARRWPLVSGLTSLTDQLAIDRVQSYNSGGVVHDSASGGLLLPGDWGVRGEM